MGMTPVGSTARWVAANRALESEGPTPLYVDPFARALAGEAGFALASEMRAAGRAPGATALAEAPDPYLTIRTRFLDDRLIDAVRTSSLDQVVILAAGLDARGLRLDWPAGVTLFEVDRDDVFDHKEAVLARLGAQPSCQRRLVRADLAGDWVPALLAAGFEPGRPAAFLVEGLLLYLDDGAVSRLFGHLGQLASPGSWLGFDVIGTEVMSSPYMSGVRAKLEELGCPWRFAVADPEAFVAQHGWQGTVVVPGEPAANFGRWPYPVAPRAFRGVPRNYLIEARRPAGASA